MTIYLPPLDLEKKLWAANKLIVAGIDEAGRGAIAGPIVAAMVILPAFKESDQILNGVKDSKLMTSLQRMKWAEIIKDHALFWSIGILEPSEIDNLGIQIANQMAMSKAIQQYPGSIDHHLFDFIFWKQCPFEGQRIKRGESASLSIAAASVIAKTTRDELMISLSSKYPDYDWNKNKGYGTKSHITAIKNYGFCPHHRRSFILKEYCQ
ncbi:MAG TPA: ribonuclease HII [Anaerolineales bacterium]|nr:ribonuclease HII [Anaerolineales bacterium]